MIEFRKLTHHDYEDIVDISKDIWEGEDYLPKIFHKWVDDDGYFLCAYDTTSNKVIGVGKFSILYDNTGWLEGLRVHIDYRGQKIARDISEKLITIAKEYLSTGKVNKIGFATYINSVESITLMQKLGFKIDKQFYLFHKGYDGLDNDLSLQDFRVEPWHPTYQEFINLPYIKKRGNLLDIAFVLQEPTLDLYNELTKSENFITINGHNGIFKLKGEPYFSVEDDNFEAINTFMNYFLLKYKDKNIPAPLTTLTDEDKDMIPKLKGANFKSWSDWKLDYLYFIYK